MRRFLAACVLAALAAVGAQAQDEKAELEQKLEARYPLTHPSGDYADILVPGVVLILKKDRLAMFNAGNAMVPGSTYKDGKIVAGFIASGNAQPKRVFMMTERMWLTGIDIKKDGVSFTLLSDPYGNMRYAGKLKFPFAKNTIPSFEEIDAEISQVFDTAMLPGARPRVAPIAPPPPEPVAAPVPPPVAPPPPPDDAAKPVVSLGQTPAQVLAALGRPQRILHPSATKQIYVYQTMQVVFTGNKVTDVQ